MIEFDEKTFMAATKQLDNMADGLDTATKKSSRNSLYKEMEKAIDREMINPVLQRAKQYAKQHVGDRAETIHPVGGSWEGNTYRAGLRSDNEVVLSHEFGSGQYGGHGPYAITPNSAEKLAFMIDGRPIIVDYVVHPGVRGKRFMQRAVQERSDEISQAALDASQETLEEALSPR